MCGINGLPIAEPRDEDFAEALLALSGVPEEPVEDVETTYQVDPCQQVDDRFYCPFPGCRRSFAELWRLKVHYRAPPNVRGSGKERGHGMRLDRCPKCNAVLKIGGHHVRCSAREAARQLAKKPRRTGPAAASEPKAAAQKQQKQQQHADEAGSDSFPDSGYTSTTAPGPHLPASHAYAHLDHQQQQQALTYSFWEQQQQPQQQQQQQLVEQPRLQVPVLPEVQQLWRLQQLLDRVDQHLGFDFDPSEAAAAVPMYDHAPVHESAAAGYGEAAEYGAAAAEIGYQPSAYHQQLLANFTGAAAAAGYGGAAAVGAAGEGSSLPPYPLTVQQQQQQLFAGGSSYYAQFGAAQDCVERQQHEASSDSSTSSGGGGGGNGRSGGSSSSLDGSRVSSIAADMHYEYTATAQQQQHEQEQAQSQLLQLLQQHAGAGPAAFGLQAAHHSVKLEHTAEPHTLLQAAAAAAASAAAAPGAAAADKYTGAVQALLQQALQTMAGSQPPQLTTHVPEPPPLQAAPPPAAAAVALAPAAAESAAEEDPAAAAAAAVAAAAVAAVQAALLQRPAQDESHLLALLRETLA